MNKVVRFYCFAKAYHDCLATYFGSPLLASGEHHLSTAFLRIRLVVEELLQDEEFHEFAPAYPSQFRSLMASDPDYPEADWELGGQQEVLNFLVQVQERYIIAGEPPLLLDEADGRILTDAYAHMDEYATWAKRRWENILKKAEATREQHQKQENNRSQAPSPATAPGAPVYITHIQSLSNSQLQVGTVHSTQSGTVGGNGDIEALKELLKVLKEQLPKLALRAGDHDEAEAEVSTLEAQAKSNRPKPKIIVESLRTLRNVVEGTTGSLLATGLLPVITDLIGRFGG